MKKAGITLSGSLGTAIRSTLFRVIKYLLANSELSAIFRFVSPQVFQVASPAQILAIGNTLRKNLGDAAEWGAVRTTHAALLNRTISSGDEVLALYFEQILTQDAWILDFRSGVFQGGAWQPRPFFFRLSSEFTDGVRNLYQGFYLDDLSRFDSALKSLGLESARAPLLRHFGASDQTSVRFSLSEFQKTFADVFTCCAKAKAKLPSEFLVLGLSLLTLYENLETRGGAFNARAAFLASLGGLRS